VRQSWMLVRFEWPINLCHESTIHAFVIEHNIDVTILRVSSRCSLTISVQVQQPHTAQKLTILIQNYYKLLQNLLCLQKLFYA
jgi:hypothetical protein